ncbi:MAG TPA: M24 family metallopeptidase [Candidatus Lustribacter sp.]|jgi:Xaa-Pro aminopeptidase|nr:M24 family metallopeptidase [Candidatus Lustribacter sp.]
MSAHVLMSSLNQWSPEWSNAVFSLVERDRRWALVRSLMAKEGIDLIVCFPLTHQHGRSAADARYLTQLGENSDEVTCAFPLEGEVTAWCSRGGVWPASNWFTDIRSAERGFGGKTITGYLREHPKLATGKIAIAGLSSTPISHIRSAEGVVNWRSYEVLRENFPNATFVSATPVLGEARWAKSAEEIAFLRKGTEVAEITLQALIDHARPGVAERELYAHMMFANAKTGASFHPMVGWVSGPQTKPYHRMEQPTFRKLEFGDLISVEVEGIWGGYHAQLDQTMAIGDAPPHMFEAMKHVWDAFNDVVAAMKPGATVGELMDIADRKGLMGGRTWVGLGMHGRGTGNDGPLIIRKPEPPEIRDLVLVEGCCFNVKPSAAFEQASDYVRWGDSVVVTKTGAERLGTRVQELPVLK